MSNPKRTGVMQTTPTSVTVKNPDGTTIEYKSPKALFSDYGVWLNTDSGVYMYTWESVSRIFYEGDSVNKVWEEAVLTVFEDLFDDYELEESEEQPKNAEKESSQDDPEVNPYESA